MPAPNDTPLANPVVAAVDVGTNSIKMTVARAGANGNLDILESASETVRLGEGVAASGQLARDRVEAALSTLTRFAELARTHGATHLIGVATEATRRAANGETFLNQVRDETGWDLSVITGAEEAALTFRGLAQGKDLAGTVVAADIGGGSTELIAAADGVVESSESIPLGSGTLTEQLVATDPPTASEFEAVRVSALSQLAAVAGERSSLDRVFVLGGTAEHLAGLVSDSANISAADISAAINRVTAGPATELAAELGIPEARARVLPAGLAIIKALVDHLQPAQVGVAQSGIRTGLILATLDEINAATLAVAPHAAEPTHPRDAMRGKIAALWEDVWNAMPAAIAGADPEGVHDVRVASRRLRAAMATANRYFPQKWYRRLHETARTITRDLGAVRDRDVLLEALTSNRKPRLNSPERLALDYVIGRVRSQRDAARGELLAFVADLEARKARDETRRRFSPPAVEAADSGKKKKTRRRKGKGTPKAVKVRRQLAADARHALKPRIAELYEFSSAIHDPHAVRKHHRARIAAKRLRYTLELFADQFGDAGDRAIDEMKELQDQLGLIHDTDVRVALIDEEGALISQNGAVDPRLAAGFANLRERQETMRRTQHSALVDRWTRLDEAGFHKELRAMTRKSPKT